MNKEKIDEKRTQELYEVLASYSATQISAVLIYCYYSAVLKTTNQVNIAEKQEDYNRLISAFDQNTKDMAEKFYRDFHNKFGDLYGVVYEYSHKSTAYKALLMII